MNKPFVAIGIGCGPAPTGKAGVYAVYGGWEGYDWRCEVCGASEIEYASEKTAAAGLVHHMRKQHPEMKPVTQEIERRDDGGIRGTLSDLERHLAGEGYRPAPELEASLPKDDLAFIRRMDCPGCGALGTCYPKAFSRGAGPDRDVLVLSVCSHCQHGEEL